MPDRNAPRLAVATERPDLEVTDALREYLRLTLGDPAVDYSSPPTPILGGFDTLIYGFELASAPSDYARPLILRRFRTAHDADRVRHESIVQNAVAALGYPAPRVLVTESDVRALGAPFSIMERMPGRVMLEALLGPEMFAMPPLLARAQARLHGLDVGEFRRSIGTTRDPRGVDSLDALLDRYARTIDASRLDGMRPALDWIHAHRPPADREAICHGDFHPLNVLVARNEVTGVIDWAGAAVADPDYDVGATVALMTQGPIDVPRLARPVVRLIRRALVGRYLRAYAAQRPLDLGRVRYFEAVHLTRFLLEVGEGMRREPADGVQWPSAFSEPHVRFGITRRLHQITGVPPRLPESK